MLLGQQTLDQSWDPVAEVALAQPEVEAHTKRLEVLAQRGHRDGHELTPQLAIPRLILLQSDRGLQRLAQALVAGPGLRRGGQVHLLQVVHRERRRRPRGGGVVERGDSPAVLELRDEHAHRRAPVAEMDVADDLVSGEPEQALERIPDDRRAQVPDVHGLGDVRPAEVEDHRARFRNQWATEALVAPDLLEERRQKLVPHGEVDEAGRRERDVGEQVTRLEPSDHVVGDRLGRTPVLLGRRQHATALELPQIRPLRRHDLPQRRVISRRRESRGDLLRQDVSEWGHLRWILAGTGGAASGSLPPPMTAGAINHAIYARDAGLCAHVLSRAPRSHGPPAHPSDPVARGTRGVGADSPLADGRRPVVLRVTGPECRRRISAGVAVEARPRRSRGRHRTRTPSAR